MSKFPDCPEGLRDIVIEWCYCNHPVLLSDDEILEGLIFFAHCVYQGAVDEERGRRWRQLTNDSSQ